MSSEKVVFSFSLFGNKKKYTEGMIINAKQISVRFPSAKIFIYIADDVPSDIRTRLSDYSSVRLINVKRVANVQNMFDRFTTIDDAECDVMFSRDADSRVHERDASCIEDFVASDKALHIIRDHPCHPTRILGGMWGMRKSALRQPMKILISTWLSNNNSDSTYGCDQRFLQQVIYPTFINNAMIHDRHRFFKEPSYQSFRAPIIDRLFVGQVHEFNDAGEEYLKHGVNSA